MNKLIVILIFSFMSSIAFAQSVIDVVYLKNGGKIKGLVIEQVPNVSLKIETADGNIFAYKMDEIEKITKERSVADSSYRSSAFRIEVGPSLMNIHGPWGFTVGLKNERMFNQSIGLDYGLEYKMYFIPGSRTINDINFAFLQLPASLILRYNLGNEKSIQLKSGLFFQSGLFLYSGTYEVYDGEMNRINLGYTGGLDFNIRHFVVGLKYDVGFLYLIPSEGGFSSLALLLGYKF